MTRSSARAVPSLIELAARSYAQGRLDSTKPGDRWVAVTAFSKWAVSERVFGTQGLQLLYARMLLDGEHVFGGAASASGPVLGGERA